MTGFSAHDETRKLINYDNELQRTPQQIENQNHSRNIIKNPNSAKTKHYTPNNYSNVSHPTKTPNNPINKIKATEKDSPHDARSQLNPKSIKTSRRTQQDYIR